MSVSALLLVAPVMSPAQSSEIVSEHIRVGIPFERQWVGRDIIPDLERFYKFVDAATAGSMPRRVAVIVRWDASAIWTEADANRVTVGMDQAAVGPDLKTFLFKQTARELARLALMKLTRQATPVQQTEFLIEGMTEILVHEFDRSSRALGGAWTIAKLLDQAGQLGIQQQMQWAHFYQGRHNLRSAAPGVTFLMTCREKYGRDKIVKLFEALRSGTLEGSFAATFGIGSAVLEATWLKKVREQPTGEDVTVTSAEDAPALEQTSTVPGLARAGQTVRLHLLIRDRTEDLPNESVFLQDTASGKVYSGRLGPDGSTFFEIPIETDRAPGTYAYRVTAIDDSGNIRNWDGQYSVVAGNSESGLSR